MTAVGRHYAWKVLAGCCGLAFFAGALPSWLLITSIILFSAFGAAGGTCCFSLIGRNFPKEMTGTGIGCVNMLWPMGAAVLNVIIGLVLNFMIGRAGGLEVLDQAAKAQIYGNAMLIFVGMWVVALVTGVFFIKEKFEVAE